MAAAVNTVANGGVRVSPSLIAGSAVTDDGITVGTDVATRTRVVSKQAARATARMMERVVDPEDGVAPRAQVPGYLVAGKTGTAQRVASDGAVLRRQHPVSFGGFAPADDARFTVYVVVHAPEGRRRWRLDRRPGRSPGSWATSWAATASSRPTASRRVSPSSGDVDTLRRCDEPVESPGATRPHRAHSTPADASSPTGSQPRTDVDRPRRPRPSPSPASR